MIHRRRLTSVILFFACAVGIITVAGCKQKIDGQVFIVTQGAENIKLGAVEVFLIDKNQVQIFLQKTEPFVESKIVDRRNSNISASNELQKAQISYDLFKTLKPNPSYYQSFLTNQIFEFYPNFSDIKPRISNLIQRAKRLSDFAAAQQTRRKNLEAQGYIINYDQETDWTSQALQAHAELESEISKLQDFVDLVENKQRDKIENAKSQIRTANALLKVCPTTDDYLNSFFPTPIQTTTTDADGRFSFSYSKSKALTIFARSQRSTLNGTEKYYWLVDVPQNGDSKIFLNNNNFTTADPDGYFPIRPTK